MSVGARRLVPMRPVTDLERRVAPFDVQSDYQPSGDQPAAIEEIAQPDQRRGEGHRPARRHRHRQDRDGRLGGRAAAAPDPGDAAQQDARRAVRQRAAPAVPRQRGRVLRLLLRLLPARGLRPADRHLHREGLLDQRGGRAAAALRDQLAAHPARRDRGVDRLLHLRPGHPAGVRRPDAAAAGRRGDRPRHGPAPARRDPVHPQRPVVHPRHVPGARRHPRDLPGLRGARGPRRVLRRRDRAADDAAPGHRRGDQRGPASSTSSRPPTTSPARSAWSARSTASRRSSRSSWPTSSATASCSRRSGCGCARPTTSR